MAINLLKELGSRCWYCGNTNPVHDKFPDHEINACRSCIKRRHKKPLEDFRYLLGPSKIAPGVDLKTLENPVTARTGDEDRAIKAMIHRTREKIQSYKFYYEGIALDCSSETASTRIWHDIKTLSSHGLLKELGSKCWYCGTLLCRYKQDWRDIIIPLRNGKYIEGREIEKVTPYYGRPTHDYVADFTVNSCRSCTSRRQRKPIEEYRGWLGVRVMPEGKELPSLNAALVTGLPHGDEERNVVEARIQQLQGIAHGYKFYAEELIVHCGREWRNAS